MQVKLGLEGVGIQLGNNGIVLKIADNDGKHVGTLRIGQATVEWRKGKTRVANGNKLSLAELIQHLESLSKAPPTARLPRARKASDPAAPSPKTRPRAKPIA